MNWIKIVGILSLSIIIVNCKSKSFYNSGSVSLDSTLKKVDITYEYNLPFCIVIIGGEEYKFLLDTGAPTVISHNIYNKLALKPHFSAKVSDSQNKKQKQNFALVPEIKIGDLNFKDIGAVVVDINNNILDCFKIDGIIGANLMAKAYFQIDYQNKQIGFSNTIENFNIDSFTHTLSFKPKRQKTPIINTKILGQEVNITYDTGFSGDFSIKNDYDNYKKAQTNKFLTTIGNSSIGIYGLGDSFNKGFVMESDIHFSEDFILEKQWISSGASSLIGNTFLKNYNTVLDWTNNKIYLKEHTKPKKSHRSFGFSYSFVDNKFIVLEKYDNPEVLLNLGDEVISINNIELVNLSQEQLCYYSLNRIEKDKESIDVVVNRNGEKLSYTVYQKDFFQ